MPADIDDTTKLSEEQRKFFSISTGSPLRRRQKTSTTFDLPYLPDQLRKRLLSNERQAHTFQWMSQDSQRNHRLVSSASLFDRNVHRHSAIFSMHVQHMIVMQHRTGAPHSVTRLRGAEHALYPCVEVAGEGTRARYRCLQRVASRPIA